MGLLYRAMWQASEGELIEVADERFRSWVEEKHEGLIQGRVGSFESGTTRAKVEQHDSDAHGRIGRWEFQEVNDHGQWIMTMIAFRESGAAEGWVWIDLQNLRSTFVNAVAIAAPRLAADLLGALPSSHRGRIALGASARALGESGLREFELHLEDGDREVPLVVFSTAQGANLGLTVRRADSAARRLAGMAQVFYLPAEETNAFWRRFGTDMAVWDGACRVYLPGIDLSDPDPRPHRYYRAHTFSRVVSRAGEQIARQISPLVAVQQPPASYGALHDLMVIDPEERLAELDREVEQLRAQNRALSDAKSQAENELEEALLDAQIYLEMSNGASHERLLTWNAIDALGLTQNVSQQMMADNENQDDPLPEAMPGSFAEIPTLAAKHLPHVAFHPDALVDHEDLEQASDREQWIQLTWRALKAFERYAITAKEFRGNFKDWCATEENKTAFPPNRVKPGESGYVKNNPDRKRERTFSVDKAVVHSGKMLMLDHVNISSRPPAPRMYFHDATKGTTGATGKIHVGYLGPHENVKNLMSD